MTEEQWNELSEAVEGIHLNIAAIKSMLAAVLAAQTRRDPKTMREVLQTLKSIEGMHSETLDADLAPLAQVLEGPIQIIERPRGRA